MRVRWVKRNRPVASVPYIQTEEGLPTGQMALVFLPHSDDGRYIGGSLYLMNRRGNGRSMNDVRIVVVASGYRSVNGDISKEEKASVRKGEAICWAETLGFRPEQVTFLDAEETYEGRNLPRLISGLFSSYFRRISVPMRAQSSSNANGLIM